MAQARTPKARPEVVTRSEPMSLDAYRDLVQRVMLDATSKSTRMARVFSNTGAEHAHIVLEAMLESATTKVDVFCRELSVGVWEADWFDSLLKRSPEAKIRILVDVSTDIKNPQSSLSKLSKMIADGNIEVKRLANPANASHITIVDRRHLRMETNHNEKKAVVSFGDEDLGAAASELFETLWGHSSSL